MTRFWSRISNRVFVRHVVGAVGCIGCTAINRNGGGSVRIAAQPDHVCWLCETPCCWSQCDGGCEWRTVAAPGARVGTMWHAGMHDGTIELHFVPRFDRFAPRTTTKRHERLRPWLLLPSLRLYPRFCVPFHSLIARIRDTLKTKLKHLKHEDLHWFLIFCII